jgi:hypothetical protein
MKKILPIILVLVVVGVGAFLGGEKYAQGKATKGSFGDNFAQRNMFANSTSTRAKADVGGMVSGEILSVDNGSLTVKLPTGGSKIVFYSDATEISKSVSGTASDLSVGKTIIASGTANKDGSVSAKTIQLRSNIAPVQ